MIFDGILLVYSRAVITEFLGTQSGFFFEPIVTCPMSPFLSAKFLLVFLDRSSVFGILACLICQDITSDVVPNVCFFCKSIVEDTQLGK